MLKAALLVLASVVTAKSCTVGFGGGDPSAPGGDTVALGVPYFAQQSAFNCGPASIQMWAAFDGRYPTQQTIAAYTQTSPTSGSSPENIVSGVQHFTSRTDAYLDTLGGINYEAQVANFYARQITSIAGHVPVLAIVNNRLHAGVVTGGTWHQDPGTGLDVWDTVSFQDPDPSFGPGTSIAAGRWRDYDGEQVISRYAVASADSYLKLYGPNVRLRGSLGGLGPPVQ